MSGAPSALRPRTAARLCAVQALYQIDLATAPADEVIAQFLAHRIGHVLEGVDYRGADRELFRAIVAGTIARAGEIDPRLAGALGEGWTLARIDNILRAILRAGAFELLAHPDVPVRVVITEYIEVAHAFFSGPEPSVVNGVLDRLARELRAPELERRAP
ncbi:MAG: transcription antitermination factor NusB [Alphaproteobacteria bacterium]|nr:transcription antitermination factor NusB [Alphaproteobacteria bacterium]